jgi:hypothetical protein
VTLTDELLDERIRAAVPRNDDSDWRDVRRRARRKRAPAALALGAIVAVLVAGPAFALRQQILDLWSSSEPAKGLYVRASADCGQGPFTLEFKPAGDAVVRQGGDVLTRASFRDRHIECDAPIHTFKGRADESPYQGELDASSYEATTLTCQTTAALQVAVSPIWNEREEIDGSTMLVADRATRELIASAVLKEPDPTASPGTSRIYYASDVCRRG